METPAQKDLERFIHERLRKLPERSAPDALIANVLRQVALRESLPWWKQPFTAWPRRNQALLFALLTGVFASVLYAAWRPAQALTLSALVEHLAAWSWVGSVAETLASSFLLLVRQASWISLACIGTLFSIMYVACVTTGWALYRVTLPTAGSRA